MIWKIVVIWSVALCVQGEEDAISEQRVVIHHHKSFRDGSLSHIGPNKSGNQDEYAQAYPSYEFSYNVNDPKTRDIKGQHETREGDEVVGNYWLIEPSGRKRTVNYQANDDIGFNAQIAYTASLKGEEKEDVSVSQVINTEKDNIEENNESGNKIAVGEEIEDIQDSNGTSESTNDPPPVEENGMGMNEQNESDNQNDERNNISNVDRTDGNLAESIQIVENYGNRENVERKFSKSEKGKRENPRKNKNLDQVHNNNESNKNSRERPKNNKRVKQHDSKQNRNRNIHKGKKANRNRNVHNHENSYINDFNATVIKGQMSTNQEHNEYGIRKAEYYNDYEEKDKQKNKNYEYHTNVDTIDRKVDVPNNEETFEHRIRIYHPKNISPTTSKIEQRKY